MILPIASSFDIFIVQDHIRMETFPCISVPTFVGNPKILDQMLSPAEHSHTQSFIQLVVIFFSAVKSLLKSVIQNTTQSVMIGQQSSKPTSLEISG